MGSSQILVPFDFSDCAQAALDFAVHLAEAMEASVHVLYVWSPGDHAPIEAMLSEVGSSTPRTLGDFARASARHELGNHVATLGDGARYVEGIRIEVGETEELILTLAEQEHYDLVVLGTQGKNGFGRELVGSITERVLCNAPCPVVTVRAATPKPPKVSNAVA